MSAWDTDVVFPASDGVKANRKELRTQYPDWVIVTMPGDTMDNYQSSSSPPPAKIQKAPVSPKDRCAYCNTVLTVENRTRDHFKPRSKGGKGGSNIVAACKVCNSVKGNKEFATMAEARAYINWKTKRDLETLRRLNSTRELKGGL